MSKRYNFTKKFQDEVHRLLREKEYIGATEYELGSKKIKTPVDIYLATQDREFLIELEIHRADPSNNIAKIAYWLHEDNTKRDITVIQFFSPFYMLESKTSAKMQESIYIGETLIEQIHGQKYHYITLDGYSPKLFEKVYTSFLRDGAPSRQSKISMKKMAKQIAEKIYVIARSHVA